MWCITYRFLGFFSGSYPSTPEYQQGFHEMVMIFQLMVEHDHETFWLFQFFLQKTVRVGPGLGTSVFLKWPLEVRQALAVPVISSSPETALWVPEELLPEKGNDSPGGVCSGCGVEALELRNEDSNALDPALVRPWKVWKGPVRAPFPSIRPAPNMALLLQILQGSVIESQNLSQTLQALSSLLSLTATSTWSAPRPSRDSVFPHCEVESFKGAAPCYSLSSWSVRGCPEPTLIPFSIPETTCHCSFLDLIGSDPWYVSGRISEFTALWAIPCPSLHPHYTHTSHRQDVCL